MNIFKTFEAHCQMAYQKSFMLIIWDRAGVFEFENHSIIQWNLSVENLSLL